MKQLSLLNSTKADPRSHSENARGSPLKDGALKSHEGSTRKFGSINQEGERQIRDRLTCVLRQKRKHHTTRANGLAKATKSNITRSCGSN